VKSKLSRRKFVNNALFTAGSLAGFGVFAAEPLHHERHGLNAEFIRFDKAGLCNPVININPCHLLSLTCIAGGNECPMIRNSKATDIISKLRVDPTIALRLMTDADEVQHYSSDKKRNKETEMFRRKMDLDVLQRLGLAPGDTRRARYLYELLFSRIETVEGICLNGTGLWEDCSLARKGAYESVRSKGWQSMVYCRPEQEKNAFRENNIRMIENSDELFIRPHHLMCLSCWYGEGKDLKPRKDDTIFEICQRIRKDPDIMITLVEGTCMVCDCCDGFHPETGRCVHSCGLIRDYKKDLDCFRKMGLMPGSSLKATDMFTLLFENIPSTKDICGYGDGIVRSNEWSVCGGPDGNPGYVKARERGIFS
jgi:hypothetical protein